jgi:hypothetical protein
VCPNPWPKKQHSQVDRDHDEVIWEASSFKVTPVIWEVTRLSAKIIENIAVVFIHTQECKWMLRLKAATVHRGAAGFRRSS